MTDPTSDLAPGTVLANRYVVGAELGAGAMGSVHLAEQTALDRTVAVKVLRTDGPVTARARRRLHREARAVARISHPNVVQVYDYGETAEARPFLVMERIDGPTASRWYRAGPTLDDVLDATDAALAGLAAAHAAGVLHRDLKPANMLVRGGDPKQLVLVDFGIAAVLRDSPDPDRAEPVIAATQGPDASRLTHPGTVMGTPLYMSPEQAMGVDAGPASDVYAMGVILYEWLHGRPPFEGPVREVLYAHVHRTLPEGDARWDLPPGLREVLRRALAKDDAKRFPDAGTMRRALQRVRRSGADLRAATPTRVQDPPTLPGRLRPDAVACLPPELPFAGREAEFLRLVALLQPSGGRGRIVLVRGPAGVGKTRLVREAVEAVVQAGAARAGSGTAREDGAPRAELLAALDELDGGGGPDSRDQEGTASPADRDDALERRARAVVAAGPAILRIEDLHRAGDATFAFFDRLVGAQLLDAFPLTIVATLGPGTDGREAVRRLGRRPDVVESIDLARLSDAGIEELLTAALALTDEAARRLAAPCGGSPLLAAQLLRHVVRERLLEPSERGWELPDDALADLGASASLEQLLRYRLDGLLAGGQAAADVLEAAAVLGDRFDVERLEAVLAVGTSPLAEEALDDVLDRLLSEGALTEPAGPGDRLQWDSGLLRSLVLGDMQGSRRRRRLSAAAARALSDVPGSERAVVELFLLAGEPLEAAPFAVDAAERAVRAGEWSDAVRLLATALSQGALSRGLRTRALFAMAEADNALGRRGEAEARYEEALAHAGTVVARARAWFGVGRSRFNRGETRAAADGLVTALEVLADHEGRAASRLRNRVLRTLAAATREAPSLELDDVRPDAPRPSDGPRERLEYFKTVGTFALIRSDLDGAVEAYRSALREARADGADADEPRVLHDLGVALRRAGRVDEARRVVTEGLVAARRVRTRPLEAKLLNELGELAREAGTPDVARDHYAAAVAIWEARGDHQAFVGRLNLALTDAESGRAERAFRSLEGLGARDGGVPARWRVPFALTSAFAAAAAGRHDFAEAELDVAVHMLREAGANPPEARSMIARVRALWEGGGQDARAGRAGLMLERLAADD